MEEENASSLPHKSQNESESVKDGPCLDISTMKLEIQQKDAKYAELERKLSRSERLVLKLQSYNDDLRNQVRKLSEELHMFRSKNHCSNAKDAAIQTEEEPVGIGTTVI